MTSNLEPHALQGLADLLEIEIAARDENAAICTILVECLNDLFNRYCVELDTYMTKVA